MATTTEEIAIDIDALDAKAAEGARNKANGTQNGHDPEAPEAKAPEKTIVSPDEGIEKLRRQLAEQTARADAAEARANDAAAGEAKARGEVQTSQLDLIKGAIERITESSNVLEDEYAEAMAAQDWKGAAKAQRRMSDNSAKLAQLEAGKVALENAPKPVPRTPTDVVEKFCADLSAPSAAWVRAHPEFVRDQHKNCQMIAAHELAMARGIKADTPEYFGDIEKTLALTAPAPKVDPKPPEQEEDPMAEAAKPAARAAPAAAPVSRSNGSRPNVVKLSPAEVEIAESMGMTAEEYARNKVALKKEGKLS